MSKDEGCTWGYAHSTPTGLGPLPGPFPRLHLNAIKLSSLIP